RSASCSPPFAHALAMMAAHLASTRTSNQYLLDRSQARTLALGLVLLLATGLRIAYLLDLWASPLFLVNALRGLAMGTYYPFGLTFASGQLPDASTPFFESPGYPLVLA